MHTYQITDALGTDMQLQARDAEDAQERFIDICEAEGGRSRTYFIDRSIVRISHHWMTRSLCWGS